MDKQTEVILAARCGAAARGGVNEDNCLIINSVGTPNVQVNHFGDGEYLSGVVSLDGAGCLLVVADGMGGMNAGEVASQMAVDTIARFFTDAKLRKSELSDGNVRKLMRKAILEADSDIRKAAAADKEKEGMGTTVVMLWLVNNKAYYAWCGDSRLYRYNDRVLDQLSNDHSYVYEVLHLSEEEAFVHPNNNIITRCLGNPGEAAVPEVSQPLPLTRGDLFLLCSDGFSGVIRNSEIVDVLQLVSEKPERLDIGVNLLWKAAETHHWHDNVTTLLCYVKSGLEKTESPTKSVLAAQTVDPSTSKGQTLRRPKVTALVLAVLFAALLFAGYKYLWPMLNQEPQETVVEPPELPEIDTVAIANTDTVSQDIPPVSQSDVQNQDAEKTAQQNKPVKVKQDSSAVNPRIMTIASGEE